MSLPLMSARRVGPMVVAVIVCSAFVALTSQSASATSKRLRGQFSSNVVTEGCLSPVAICTEGTLTGGLNGSFAFTATSLVPTADTPTTGVLLYTGDIVVTTHHGTFTCKDAGAFESTGAGAVSSVCHIVSGTGDFSSSTGSIQFVGNFTFEGGGEGEYRAVIND